MKQDLSLLSWSLEDCSLGKGSPRSSYAAVVPLRKISFLIRTYKLKLSEQCPVSTAQLGYHSEETASSLGDLQDS